MDTDGHMHVSHTRKLFGRGSLQLPLRRRQRRLLLSKRKSSRKCSRFEPYWPDEERIQFQFGLFFCFLVFILSHSQLTKKKTTRQTNKQASKQHKNNMNIPIYWNIKIILISRRRTFSRLVVSSFSACLGHSFITRKHRSLSLSLPFLSFCPSI